MLQYPVRGKIGAPCKLAVRALSGPSYPKLERQYLGSLSRTDFVRVVVFLCHLCGPESLRVDSGSQSYYLQCCAHSAAVLFVIQTQIMECMYVKDCSTTIVLQLSRPDLHHREQYRNRRPEDQRRTEEQQERSSRATAGQQSRSNKAAAGRCVHFGLLALLHLEITLQCNKS